MNRPAGNDGAGPDLLDALQDIKNDMRNEFDKKLKELRLTLEDKLNKLRDELMKKIEELEKKDQE